MYIMSDTERACRGTPIATERTFSILKVKCIPHLSELYNSPPVVDAMPTVDRSLWW